MTVFLICMLILQTLLILGMYIQMCKIESYLEAGILDKVQD